MAALRPFWLKYILNWLPAFLSVAMIAGESSATMSAENTSHWLFPFWVRLFGPISAQHWNEVHHLMRKAGHFVGYGIVSLAFFHGWITSLAPKVDQSRPVWGAVFRALLCTVIVAVLDEYHQSFLPSRTSSSIDVCIDTCGAIVAQLFILRISSCHFGRPTLTERSLH